MKSVVYLCRVGGLCLLAGCVADSSNLWDFKEVDVNSELNISFYPEGDRFRRIDAKANRNEVGWVEQGTWRETGESGATEVWIFVAALYTRAFSRDNMSSMTELARRVTGRSYVDVYSEGQISSNSGPIEYIYYRASGQPCVLIRKYWSDPRLNSDASRAIALQWVAGRNLVRAYYCRPDGDQVTRAELERLMEGIEVQGLYWPDSMFVDSS